MGILIMLAVGKIESALIATVFPDCRCRTYMPTPPLKSFTRSCNFFVSTLSGCCANSDNCAIIAMTSKEARILILSIGNLAALPVRGK